MRRKDRYKSFSQLSQKECENRDFCILVTERQSPVAILAPHAGSIEHGTSRIARHLAGDDFSLYRFIGMKKKRSWALHITSVNFDEPACARLLVSHETIVTVHGCTGEAEIVYVGGLDNLLKGKVTQALIDAGFRAEIVVNQNGLAGRDPRNLCNRGKSGRGLQLELDTALRRSLFERTKGAQRNQPTPAFFRFVSAVRSVLEEDHRDQNG